MSTGQFEKQKGQQLALFNAGADWKCQVMHALRHFCRDRKSSGRPQFRFEEFRASVEHGAKPSHPNAWGALPRIALKEKLISDTGRFEPATSARTRCHPVRVWTAL